MNKKTDIAPSVRKFALHILKAQDITKINFRRAKALNHMNRLREGMGKVEPLGILELF